MNASLVTTIHSRFQKVLNEISKAAIGSGRRPESIQLVVVSKSQPLEVVEAAISAGISSFGENYAEETIGKINALKDLTLHWHMIGHVQSRKAELVAVNFTMLHSLDSMKLAFRLEHFCAELNKVLPVLLEFNVSGEESKFGFPAWEESHWPSLVHDLEPILSLPHLAVSGLMTMPPYFDDPELTRPYFKKLRDLQDFLARQFPLTNWQELSMGTSVDFVSAIQEGATFLRIGQAILGPRS